MFGRWEQQRKKVTKEKGKEGHKDAVLEVDMEATNQSEKGKKKMMWGKRKCKRCGELGHSETSYKCPLNGTKKRKRRPRINKTKYGENTKIPKSRLEEGVQGEGVIQGEAVV